nr:class B sortase [Collinsella urealyticum]
MPVAGMRWARTGVRVASAAFDALAFAFLFVVFIVGLYALWDAQAVYGSASAPRWQAFMPTPESQESYDELVAANPDVVGWLDIYGTHINYPLVQGETDSKYLNRDAKGAYSLTGSLFLDSSNARDFTDFNTVIYGHHLDCEAMFGEIGEFANPSFFASREFGTLFVGTGPYAGMTFGLHILGFLPADAYDGAVYRPGVVGASEQEAYLEHLRSLMTCSRTVQVVPSDGDRILLLSTCSDAATNARSILVVKVESEVHEDTFKEEVRIGVGIDLPEGWLSFPWTGWAALLALLALLVGVILRQLARRHAKKRERRVEGKHFSS